MGPVGSGLETQIAVSSHCPSIVSTCRFGHACRQNKIYARLVMSFLSLQTEVPGVEPAGQLFIGRKIPVRFCLDVERRRVRWSEVLGLALISLFVVSLFIS